MLFFVSLKISFSFLDAAVRKITRKSRFAISNWERSLKTKELKLQKQRVTLEKKRLLLEEKKFALEKMERHKRLEVEIKERENNILISQQQQRIIDFFVDHFHNKSNKS